MKRLSVILALLVGSIGGSVGCNDDAPRPRSEPRLRLWHAFSPGETKMLNGFLAGDWTSVDPTVMPFARARLIVLDALEQGTDCPDLVRIDATWLPELVDRKLLLPAPEAVRGSADTWLEEAQNLAQFGDTQYGAPQTIDGLALLYNERLVEDAGIAWPPPTLNDLMASAHQLTREGRYGLSARVDGYWFAAFLRAAGGNVLNPLTGALNIDAPVARTALDRFARLFREGGVAPPPPASGDEAPAAARRFRRGDVAVLVAGPWSVAALRGSPQAPLAVAPFPRDPLGRAAAPLGGQLFVVPRCARHPKRAWQLASALTAPALQARWADELGLVPTRTEGLARANDFTRAFAEALLQARPLPRHAMTTELFDDLTPAVAAVVAGDATPDEALDGVARAWRRIARRRGIEPLDWTPPPDGEDGDIAVGPPGRADDGDGDGDGDADADDRKEAPQ